MSSEEMPRSLREAVAADLEPVRPIRPTWRRTLLVAAVATAVLAAMLLTGTLRPDLAVLPGWLSWGATLVELAVAMLIVGLALREAVPGAAVPTATIRAAAALGLVLQVLVGVATWVASPGMAPGPAWFAKGATCLSHDTALILPTFAVTMWLVFRAVPMRAPVAGLLGGLGAALAGDAVTHLLCPLSDLRHVLAWHTGAILGFAAVGWLVGTLWSRRWWRHSR